jgi:hypothetical protein
MMMRSTWKKKEPPKEDLEQIRLATWLDKKGILFYAVPNGGRRYLLEAVKFKRMGVKSGVPDLCIPLPTKSHHGLYIELKRKSRSATSDNQLYWIERLKKNGYAAHIAKGADEAIKIVCDYLGIEYNE